MNKRNKEPGEEKKNKRREGNKEQKARHEEYSELEQQNVSE